jgi:carbon storage regulator
VLVLSRKPEQSLHLGDEITVTVLGIEGDRVKLGINAPRTVAVLRHEVFEQIQAANLGAASSAVSSLATIASALRSR